MRGLRAAAVLAVFGVPGADARAAPVADPFIAALAQYRAAPVCAGAAYARVNSALWAALDAYHVTDPARAAISVQAGRRAAQELDALAATAYAKGCAAVANETWWYLLRVFTGPVFTDFQLQAVAGLRALRRNAGE